MNTSNACIDFNTHISSKNNIQNNLFTFSYLNSFIYDVLFFKYKKIIQSYVIYLLLDKLNILPT